MGVTKVRLPKSKNGVTIIHFPRHCLDGGTGLLVSQAKIHQKKNDRIGYFFLLCTCQAKWQVGLERGLFIDLIALRELDTKNKSIRDLQFHRE